jgi:hypothetical protein
MYATCTATNHVPGCEHIPCKTWIDRARNFILPSVETTGSITFGQAADMRRARRQAAVAALRGNK